MRNYARIGVASGAIALSLTLAACGGNSTSSTSSTATTAPRTSTSTSVDATHNAADVSFTQSMIVHHQGAIQMAQVAEKQASTQQVKDLAKRIEAAQGPEIDEMTSWLKAWGEPGPASGSMGNMGSGAMGMMTDEQMNQLMGAQGTNFDRMFLEMMTIHHQGAIEMAKTEQANGSNPQAKALAQSIETSQTAEVTEMAQMLKNL